MKSKIAIAVLAAALVSPTLWADEATTGTAPDTGASASAPKAHKKHHKGMHHKKMKKAESGSTSESAPATTPAGQ